MFPLGILGREKLHGRCGSQCHPSLPAVAVAGLRKHCTPCSINQTGLLWMNLGQLLKLTSRSTSSLAP